MMREAAGTWDANHSTATKATAVRERYELVMFTWHIAVFKEKRQPRPLHKRRRSE
jgi:hypothetical protein